MSDKETAQSIARAYQDRLKYLRKGQEAFYKKDVSKGVQFYATYLKALANYFEVEENYLEPKYFDLNRDKAELLLISQVYWDLAKAYDRSPGLQKECTRCINQFVKFTVGFKHQHINAQVLKKYVRLNSAVNQSVFKDALKKIHVDSKSCYVATYAFGNDHDVTRKLREFKKEKLQNTNAGLMFIDFYYSNSPKLIHFCEDNPYLGQLISKYLFKPLIKIFLKLFNIRG